MGIISIEEAETITAITETGTTGAVVTRDGLVTAVEVGTRVHPAVTTAVAIRHFNISDERRGIICGG